MLQPFIQGGETTVTQVTSKSGSVWSEILYKDEFIQFYTLSSWVILRSNSRKYVGRNVVGYKGRASSKQTAAFLATD